MTMNERKKNMAIWALLIVLSAVSAWFIVAGKMQYMEREFANINEARAAGEPQKGWLPSFLPEDATAIKVINNTDNRSALVYFGFQDGIDLSACEGIALSNAALPAERVVLWWPEELTQNGMKEDGYSLYRCKDGQAAVNAAKKEAYFWK